jgi:hypothetical protein
MTTDDWRALLEAFLADETDAESFHDDFLEGWKSARDERKRIPDAIEDLFFTVESFTPGDDDESELRDEVQKVLDILNKSA